MKKHLLFAGLLFGTIFTTNAQTVILSNNFGTDNASLAQQIDGWDISELDNDNDTFGYGTDPAITALGFTGYQALSASFINTGTDANPIITPTTPSNLYTSPIVDLTSISNAYLTFKIGSYGASTATMNYEVLILTDAQYNDGTFDYATLTPVLSGSSSGQAAADKLVILDTYAGQQIHVVFHHIASTGNGYLILDDIVLKSGVIAGVNDVLSSKFSVYPNPASNIITVNSTGNILINNLTVTDLNGRVVKTINFDGIAAAQLNISDIASGMYVINIASDRGTTSQKIIKQ